jgi:transcriptional regulator with XRE-family HTH domain
MDDTSLDGAWYEPEAATFGDRLIGAREAAGMNQAELARRIGVKLKTLRAWEDDQDEPRANRLAILCGVLNVPLTWLLTGSGPVPASGEDAEGRLLEEVGALRRDAAQLAERLTSVEARLRARLGQGG